MPAFKLDKDPFPETSARDPFYFSTRALAARIGHLRAALALGHVLVVDEEGSGRTTLLARFVESAGEGVLVACIRGEKRRPARAVVHALAESFGLPPREPAAAELRDMDTYLERVERRSGSVVVAVDDGDRLDDEALGQLLYLARRWNRLGVRFLIAGAPRLAERLAALPAAERLPGRVTTLDLPRFDESEVSDYLHMRLFSAGLAGDSPFGPDVAARVARESRGLVGAIDGIARGILREIGETGDAARDATPRWPLAIVATAALGVMLALALPGGWWTAEKARAGERADIFRSRITPAVDPSVERRRARSAAADALAPGVGAGVLEVPGRAATRRLRR